jgi:polysaccharide export outer membrane protein
MVPVQILRSAFVISVLGLAALPLRANVEAEKSIPKPLVEYVRDAGKAGLDVSQIRQNAVSAGWSEAVVDQALGSMNPAAQAVSEKTPAPAATPKTAEPKAPELQMPAAPQATAEPAAQDTSISEAREATASVTGGYDEYVIGEGDVLQIAVFGEPTASVPNATVRPDGKISAPLIKEVQVAGLTPSQVQRIMQDQLSKSIREPDVTVVVAQINSKKIYLTGAVRKEGPLKYTYRMTVLQAISEAGGLTDYAKRKKIYVLHHENGREYKLPFDYTAVLNGERMEQNIVLSPGDTIVVP